MGLSAVVREVIFFVRFRVRNLYLTIENEKDERRNRRPKKNKKKREFV